MVQCKESNTDAFQDKGHQAHKTGYRTQATDNTREVHRKRTVMNEFSMKSDS